VKLRREVMIVRKTTYLASLMLLLAALASGAYLFRGLSVEALAQCNARTKPSSTQHQHTGTSTTSGKAAKPAASSEADDLDSAIDLELDDQPAETQPKPRVTAKTSEPASGYANSPLKATRDKLHDANEYLQTLKGIRDGKVFIVFLDNEDTYVPVDRKAFNNWLRSGVELGLFDAKDARKYALDVAKTTKGYTKSVLPIHIDSTQQRIKQLEGDVDQLQADRGKGSGKKSGKH
jgi:hypothetical protein